MGSDDEDALSDWCMMDGGGSPHGALYQDVNI